MSALVALLSLVHGTEKCDDRANICHLGKNLGILYSREEAECGEKRILGGFCGGQSTGV